MQYWRKSNFDFSYLFNVIRRNLVIKMGNFWNVDQVPNLTKPILPYPNLVNLS